LEVEADKKDKAEKIGISDELVAGKRLEVVAD
jgi:hypothetical protein